MPSVTAPKKFEALEPLGYQIQGLVGQGGFGSVFMAMHKPSGETRAVKAVCTEDCNRAEIDHEILVMRKMKAAPNIVKLFDVAEDQSFIFICMEACLGGHLLARLWEHAAQMTEHHAARAVRDVLSGLASLHEAHIAHRDVKPQNLIYATASPDSPLKLIDFGMAVDLGSPKGTVLEFAGSIRFMSPSIVTDTPYGLECDLWAVGVTAFLLLSGSYPFNGSTVDEVADLIAAGAFDFGAPEWSYVSAEGKDFVSRLLRDKVLDEADELVARASKKPPPRRPPAFSSAKEALRHPWIVHRGPPGTGLLDASVRDALHAIHERNLLDTAVSNFVSGRLRQQDLNVLIKEFDRLDRDKSGTVSLAEYLQGVASLEVTLDELKEQFKTHDLNRDQELSRAEFITACVDHTHLPDADATLRAAFDKLAESVGAQRRITAKSLAYHLSHDLYSQTDGAPPLDGDTEESIKQRARKAVADADINHDGSVDYDEFHAWSQRARSRKTLKGSIKDGKKSKLPAPIKPRPGPGNLTLTLGQKKKAHGGIMASLKGLVRGRKK